MGCPPFAFGSRYDQALRRRRALMTEIYAAYALWPTNLSVICRNPVFNELSALGSGQLDGEAEGI